MATRMVEFTGCRDRLCSGDRPTGEDAGGERVPRLRRSPRGQPEEPHGHRHVSAASGRVRRYARPQLSVTETWVAPSPGWGQLKPGGWGYVRPSEPPVGHATGPVAREAWAASYCRVICGAGW